MNFRLPPSQSRAFALGILFLFLLALISAVTVPAWMLHSHYGQAISDYQDKIIRYRRFAEQAPLIQAEIDKVRSLNARKYFLKVNNPSLAASEMQDLVKQFIESRRGKLTSVQILPPKDEGKYRRIGLAVQANVTALALQQILHGIDSREPYIFVDVMSVRAGQGRLYRPMPGVEPEFSLQLTVHGYAIINP
jgi:general secretion pathway protein M